VVSCLAGIQNLAEPNAVSIFEFQISSFNHQSSIETGGFRMAVQHAAQHSIESTNLADLLERVLDKGIVIAGDITIKLVDIELLTIQLRLVICSVDKAKEMGMDWWVNNPLLSSKSQSVEQEHSLSRIEERLENLEKTAGK
jgi:hypothetical protein